MHAGLPASLAEALHLDVAHTLLAQGNSPAEAASHLVIGARRGDAPTIALLDTATAEIAPTAPAAAADIALRTLELVDPGSPQWAQATMRAMMLLSFSGRPRQAQEIGRTALGTGVDETTEAMILVSMGQALTVVGLYGAAPELADRVLAKSGLPDRVRLSALYLLASAGTHAGRDVVPSIDEAWDLATAMGSTDDLVNLLGRKSYLATRSGDLDEGLDIAREALRLADANGAAPLTPRAPRLAIVFTLSLLDRTDEAREQLAIVARDGEEVGLPWAVLLSEQARAGVLLSEGQLQNAAAAAESAWEDARHVDLEPIMPDSLHILAQVAMRQGDLELAGQYVDRLETLMADGAALVSTSVNTVRARLSFANGDPGRALRELEPVFEHEYLHTLLRNDSVLAPEIVRIALAAGVPGRAQEIIERAETFAERNPGVASITGQVAHAEGLLSDDVDALRRALADYEQSPRVLQRAVAGEDLAARAGPARRAGRGRRPARGCARRVRRALRDPRCGPRARPPPRAGGAAAYGHRRDPPAHRLARADGRRAQRRPPRRRGPHEPPDRRSPLPLPPHRQHPPAACVRQAPDPFPRRAGPPRPGLTGGRGSGARPSPNPGPPDLLTMVA